MVRLLDRLGGYLPGLLALGLPIVFLPTAGDAFILPRASLVIGGACLGVGVALVLGAGGLGEMRWPLLAAAAAAVLAFLLSVSWPLSLAGSYTRYESLPMRLSYLGLFASAVWLMRDRASRGWVIAAFVIGTSVASLEAVQQWSAHVAFRPDGNLGNANLLAALISMAVPLAVSRTLRGGLSAVAWAAGAVVLVAGLLVTTSRSGALGVVAGCLALVTLSVPRRFGPAVGVVSAAVLGAAMLLIVASPLRGLNDDPATLRLHLWQDGLRLVTARPLTGWGEDATGLVFGHYLSRDYASLVTFDRVHSGPLDVAAMQGVLGLAALGWVLFVLFRRAWEHRDAAEVPPLAGALVGYTVWVLFNFDWAPATGVFWLLAGTLWAGIEKAPPHSWGGGPSPRSGEVPPLAAGMGQRRRGWRDIARPTAAIALVVAAVVFAVFPVLADVWYLRGRSDLAIQVDPLQAQYHWAIGSLPELRRAADLGETTPDLYVQLGDAELRAGDRAAARRAYERALEIDPYFTPASQRLTALGG